MDDGREGLTDIDRAIVQALDVEPSPEFLAHVRQRVGGERMRPPFWRVRLWVPLAGAVAVVLLAVVLLLPGKRATPPEPFVAVRSTVGDKAPPNSGVSQAEQPRAGIPEVRVPTRRVVDAAARRTKEPEVLVPREEIEMYRRLIAGARAVPGAVVVEATADVAANRTFEDITIDPITIDLIAPPEGGEGVRQ